MSNDTAAQVSKLHYHQQRRMLDVTFSNGDCVSFSAEFLRVYSPSAEVRGHGKAKLVTNKKQVTIQKLLPAGHYAVKLVFDDGHDTGLYSWQYLWQLAQQKDSLWQQYLQQLDSANANRDAVIAVRVQY